MKSKAILNLCIFAIVVCGLAALVSCGNMERKLSRAWTAIQEKNSDLDQVKATFSGNRAHLTAPSKPLADQARKLLAAVPDVNAVTTELLTRQPAPNPDEGTEPKKTGDRNPDRPKPDEKEPENPEVKDPEPANTNKAGLVDTPAPVPESDPKNPARTNDTSAAVNSTNTPPDTASTNEAEVAVEPPPRLAPPKANTNAVTESELDPLGGKKFVGKHDEPIEFSRSKIVLSSAAVGKNKKSDRQNLEEVAERLKDDENLVVKVEAFVAFSRKSQSHVELGAAMLRDIRHRLIQLGVAEERIFDHLHGVHNPLIDKDNPRRGIIQFKFYH